MHYYGEWPSLAVWECWNQPITGLASRISLALTLLGLVLPLFLMLYVVAFPPRYSINQSIQPTRDHPFSHPFQQCPAQWGKDDLSALMQA